MYIITEWENPTEGFKWQIRSCERKDQQSQSGIYPMRGAKKLACHQISQQKHFRSEGSGV